MKNFKFSISMICITLVTFVGLVTYLALNNNGGSIHFSQDFSVDTYKGTVNSKMNIDVGDSTSSQVTPIGTHTKNQNKVVQPSLTKVGNVSKNENEGTTWQAVPSNSNKN